MKIALLSTFPPKKCGIGVYSDNLLNGLKKVDKNLKIITIGTKDSDADYKLNFKSVLLKYKLKDIIKKEKIELIHIQHNYPHFCKFFNLNLIRSLKLPIPTIVTLHEVQYPQKLSFFRKLRLNILKMIEKNIVKRATRIIVHSPKQKSFLKRSNVVCVYHGLELLKENKRKGKNLLFLGIINPTKGVHILIKAMDYLKGYNLTIAGNVPDPKYKAVLLEMLKQRKIDYNFKWLSSKEKWSYYQKADAVVLPYTWAPYQSGILHNAISVSVPIVVTKVGALPEIVEEFNLGEISESNPKALAGSIIKLFKNYPKYKKGISTYRKKANWQQVAKEHIQVYKSLIKA
jgi:glycosyltransferase involved in cell wall biosynthesis